MSGRTWQPGDVARTKRGGTVARTATHTWVLLDDGRRIGLDHDPHPLLVIDPEDREQVKRLADVFCLARWSHVADSTECDPLTFDSMQTALREYLNPTPPKPEEPTGLGAVVTDDDGTTWVLFGNGCWGRKVPNANLDVRGWERLNVSTPDQILSAGWVEDGAL